MTEVFKMPKGENRRPHQVALEWLIAQNLRPGDTITWMKIDDALCLVDPDTLPPGRKPQQDWVLRRLGELSDLREAYEERTGDLLVPARGGGLLVCPRNEVADTLMDEMFSTMQRTFRRVSTRILRATRAGVSQLELDRRNKAIEKVAGMRAFLARERRISLSD